MLDDQERLQLLRARSRERRKTTALAAIPVLLALTAVVNWQLHLRLYSHGPAGVFSLVAILWMALLRQAPGQLRRINADLADSAVRVAEGTGTLLSRRSRAEGIERYRLLLDGGIFEAGDIAPHLLHPGKPVRLRCGLRSGVLLSVTPLVPALDIALAERAAGFSGRELQLLSLLQAGLSDKLIARRLELSPATVRTYNSTIFRKLGVNDRSEAIARARELNLPLSTDIH